MMPFASKRNVICVKLYYEVMQMMAQPHANGSVF